MLELPLGAGCRLTGVARDEGRALSGFELVLASGFHGDAGWERFEPHQLETRRFAARTTEADGSFAFEGVPPGDWALAPGGDTLGLPRAAFCFRIGPEELTRAVELQFERATIRGRVLDPGGASQAGAFVRAQSSSARGFDSITTTAADGTFELTPLVGGMYYVSASSKERFHVRSRQQRVAAGSEDIVLRLGWGGVLRGRVTNDRDEPRSAEITVWREGRWQGAWEGANFAFRGLEPGLYDLVATTRDGKIGVVRGLAVEARAESEPFTVRVAPGCKALFRLSDEHEESCGFYATWSGIRVADGNVRPGREVSRTLPCSEVVVHWGWAEAASEERRALVPHDAAVFVH